MTILHTIRTLLLVCLFAMMLSPGVKAQNNDNLLDTRPRESIAVEEGDLDSLRSLLIGGSNTGVSDASGRSLLMIAASRNDIDIMELLFDYDAQIEQRDVNGATALHWAVRSNAIDATILLLENGANPNAQDNQGMTPVMQAVRKNDRYLVEEILLAKPDLTIADYTGRTALDWARSSRDSSIATMLEEAGAS